MRLRNFGTAPADSGDCFPDAEKVLPDFHTRLSGLKEEFRM